MSGDFKQEKLDEILMALKDSGLSQKDLAEFLDVREATVSGWMHGKVPLLSISQVEKLSVALSCTLAELVEVFQPEAARSRRELRAELNKILQKKKPMGRPSKKKSSNK